MEKERQIFIEYIDDSIKEMDDNYSNWCVGVGDPTIALRNHKNHYPLVQQVISDRLSTKKIAEEMRDLYIKRGCTNHPNLDDALSSTFFLIYKFPIPFPRLK